MSKSRLSTLVANEIVAVQTLKRKQNKKQQRKTLPWLVFFYLRNDKFMQKMRII